MTPAYAVLGFSHIGFNTLFPRPRWAVSPLLSISNIQFDFLNVIEDIWQFILSFIFFHLHQPLPWPRIVPHVRTTPFVTPLVSHLFCSFQFHPKIPLT